MNRDPYRQAHPRRTDWLRVVLAVLAAVILAIALYAAIVLAIVWLG